VIGALAEVDRVTIWSDVAGVYSADPRLVSDACLLPLLRLDEASELARLAAPVLHSRTLQPVAQSAMDLSLRCSYQPESGSTQIERVLASGRGAKIITSLDDVLLIQLTFGHGHDFERLESEVLEGLKRAQLAPLAYELHSDQNCLRLAYTEEIAGGALEYLQDHAIEAEIKLKEGYSLVAAVGAGVTKNPNHCYGFYQQLKGAPVEFISESQSRLSLVAVVRKSETETLVKGIHSQLFQAQKRVAIALCGKGNIGSSWLSLFAEQKVELEKRRGMNFELVAVVDSQTYWYDEQGIDARAVADRFDDEAVTYEDGEWLTKLGSIQGYDEVVVLDVTASKVLADRYLDIAQQGIHLISANKVAGSASSEYYHQVQDAFAKISRHWLYNATVGAGLPINHTVRDLRESGDDIIALSGIFSGTLSWLFQQFDGSVPFSELVDLAWQQGLTEPDPRSDLDGSDVMRKLVILARESGLDIEPENVKVESLVPQELQDLSVDDFFDKASVLSEVLAERLEKAQSQQKVLRYVARLEKNGKATVGVEALSKEHALANLLPCDNIFAIESKWYKDNPLVIRGPGAGREVTAGAIQSDLNRMSSLF
jgi:aspartokinase/homoserine dehydrogenase 2